MCFSKHTSWEQNNDTRIHVGKLISLLKQQNVFTYRKTQFYYQCYQEIALKEGFPESTVSVLPFWIFRYGHWHYFIIHKKKKKLIRLQYSMSVWVIWILYPTASDPLRATFVYSPRVADKNSSIYQFAKTGILLNI